MRHRSRLNSVACLHPSIRIRCGTLYTAKRPVFDTAARVQNMPMGSDKRHLKLYILTEPVCFEAVSARAGSNGGSFIPFTPLAAGRTHRRLSEQQSILKR